MLALVLANTGLIFGVSGGVLYLLLLVLGLIGLRKGHWVMFIIGFFIPMFWLIAP